MWYGITLKQILILNSHRIFFFFFMRVQWPQLVVISWIQIGKQQFKLYRLDRGVLLCSSLAAANECHPAWCRACLLTQRGNCSIYTHSACYKPENSEKTLIFINICNNKEKNKTNHLYSRPNPHSCSSQVGGLKHRKGFSLFLKD